MVSILPTKLRIQSFYLTKSTNLKHDVMPLRMLDEYAISSSSVFNLSPHSPYSLSPLSSHSQKKLFRHVIKVIKDFFTSISTIYKREEILFLRF